jgi:hypothetical protein
MNCALEQDFSEIAFGRDSGTAAESDRQWFLAILRFSKARDDS